MSQATPPSDRTRVRRAAARGVYDRAQIHAILDEALVCHVGFVDDGQPFVIPTLHVRVDDALFLHGSRSSRMLGRLAAGEPACVTVTLIDGIVVARSAMHSSMNYRSVVVLGGAAEVTDPAEKQRVFAALVEQIVPGRSSDIRLPSDAERDATMLVRLPLDEASAKVRTGPPIDDENDYTLPHWAGVIPLTQTAGRPVADPRLDPAIAVPDYARRYARPASP